MMTPKDRPLDLTGALLTKEYYCIRPKPDCNNQGLKQCDYCVWFVEQIKKARQEGIKEGKGK